MSAMLSFPVYPITVQDKMKLQSSSNNGWTKLQAFCHYDPIKKKFKKIKKKKSSE